MSRRRLTHDEDALWRTATADVRPLTPMDPPAGKVALTALPPEIKNVDTARSNLAHPKASSGEPQAGSADRSPVRELSAGQTDGLDRRRLDRLKRGRTPIDAVIDLHGLNQASAHRLLERTIADSVNSGRRCLLVITGKGALSQGGGILRQRLADWLNLPACRPHVLSFVQAQPQHGGAGAFYVLLRRRRG